MYLFSLFPEGNEKMSLSNFWLHKCKKKKKKGLRDLALCQ